MPAEPPTVAPCGCCRELIEIIAFGTYFDSDLQQYVCPDCAKRLRNSVAWLNHHRIKDCHRTNPDIELRPLFA